jgi:hypothetical protein
VQNTDLLNRREFTLQAALAMLSGVAITVSGCGGSSSPASPSPSPSTSDVAGSISANHGHTATISRARLTAGSALSLDIRGGADHPHTVQLSQNDLTTIASGQRVSVISSSDQQHSHTVTFN